MSAPVSHDQLGALWEAWLDGTIGEADAARLAQALREDPASLAALREQAGMDGALRALATAADPEPLVRGFREELAARRDEGRFVAAFQDRQRRAAASRGGRRYAVVAAAVAAAALVAVVAATWRREPSLATIADGAPGARVVRGGRTHEARTGTPLRAGDALAAADRELVFDYPDGAWMVLGPDARARVERPAVAEKRLVLDGGWLSSDLTDVPAAGPVAVETPHVSVEGRAADFRITVAPSGTAVEVWAGALTVVTRAPVRRVTVRAGESASAGPTGAPVVQRRPTLADLAAPPRASGPPRDTAQTTRALQAAPVDARATAGAPLPLPWSELRQVGTGAWTPLADGVRQTTPSTEYAWDYAKGAVNMAQLDLHFDGSLRARARVRPDGAPGKWNAALVLRFGVPSTINCSYTVRGASRVSTLEFTDKGGSASGWTPETYPRAAGPVSFDESYWFELEIRRGGDGRATAECRVWAEGAPRPDAGLRGDVDVEGAAQWVGMRTYRTTATFDAVEVTAL